MALVTSIVEHVFRPNYAKAKAEAARLLDTYGFTEPPVDPVMIARDLGIKVTFVNFPQDPNISGFFDPSENLIFVNKTESPLRQTFTIAHELGHQRLHLDWAKSSDYKVLMRDQAATSKDPIEQEANAFAAHLLVPRKMLDRYRKVANIQELSKLFMVSAPVIKNRMKLEYGS